MPHIPLRKDLYGIRALFAFRPDAAKPMCELADVLLRQPNSLTPAERELIATYVSHLNDCDYCQNAHGAIAACHLDGYEQLVEEVKRDFTQAGVSDKLKALLAIAAKVQQSGKNVLAEDIERARQTGATDMEIHDTVVIAASFCMFNRYVDGLATLVPPDPALYKARAPLIAREGYVAALREMMAKTAGQK